MIDKAAINARFSELYDQGMREGKHGHYETCFRAMHEAYAPYVTQAPVLTAKAPASVLHALEAQAAALFKQLALTEAAFRSVPKWKVFRRASLMREADDTRRNLSLAKAAIRHWQARHQQGEQQ